MADPLTEELLALPTGTALAPKASESTLTREIEVSEDTVTATIRDVPGAVNEGTGLRFLEDEGLNPDDWEATGFRKIEYGAGLESVKFTYRRRFNTEGRPSIDELVAIIEGVEPHDEQPTGDHGFVVMLGDMQFGKIDGDGVDGTLRRTLACLEKALARYLTLGDELDFGHVHIAWLGDHIEGFNSQGGANVWRTGLTLTEQIRLTRRVMLHAMLIFAPHTDKLTMAAVPGNHGETVRLAGKGLTRYDDSHDTDCLVAVSEAARLNPEAFGHVEFYVPDTDEMTVVLDVAGTRIGHVHGHQFRPNKHFEWWRGQSFGNSPLRDADILLAGHLHHEHVEADGGRLFIQVPTLEGESTWWKHLTGTKAEPGLMVGVAKDGRMDRREVVRA